MIDDNEDPLELPINAAVTALYRSQHNHHVSKFYEYSGGWDAYMDALLVECIEMLPCTCGCTTIH